jgi:hypothetical protein
MDIMRDFIVPSASGGIVGSTISAAITSGIAGWDLGIISRAALIGFIPGALIGACAGYGVGLHYEDI